MALDAELAAFERSSRLPLPVQFWHVREELSIVREKTRQAAVEFQRAAEMQRDGLLSLQDVERAVQALIIMYTSCGDHWTSYVIDFQTIKKYL